MRNESDVRLYPRTSRETTKIHIHPPIATIVSLYPEIGWVKDRNTRYKRLLIQTAPLQIFHRNIFSASTLLPEEFVMDTACAAAALSAADAEIEVAEDVGLGTAGSGEFGQTT